MESTVKVFGHSAHQAFVVIPAGLLIGSVGFDIAALLRSVGGLHQTAFHLLGAGVIAGLIAAPIGALDWKAIPPDTRAKRIGGFHAASNVLALALFAWSWSLRRGAPEAPSLLAVSIAIVALASLLLGSWFGGELVSRLGIGVSEGAGLNAPNSMLQGPRDSFGSEQPERRRSTSDRRRAADVARGR